MNIYIKVIFFDHILIKLLKIFFKNQNLKYIFYQILRLINNIRKYWNISFFYLIIIFIKFNNISKQSFHYSTLNNYYTLKKIYNKYIWNFEYEFYIIKDWSISIHFLQNSLILIKSPWKSGYWNLFYNFFLIKNHDFKIYVVKNCTK